MTVEKAVSTIVKPFDTYRIRYGTTNPNGYDLTRIEFYYGATRVGRILSGKAIGPGSYVSLKDGEIYLYFDSGKASPSWRCISCRTTSIRTGNRDARAGSPIVVDADIHPEADCHQWPWREQAMRPMPVVLNGTSR
jgi:hypothetical protein